MTDVQAHPSELQWARHLSREGSFLERRHVRRHLARCAACRAYEAEQSRAREAFEGDPRTREAMDELRARAAATAPPPRGGRPTWFGAIGVLGVAAAALALILLRPGSSPELLAKGGDRFAVYVQRPGGPVTLGGRCAPGDRLMAGWRTSRPYLLLLERDGRGAVQVLFPPGGAGSGRVPAAEGTTPTSWILDDAPGRECFAAFFSDEPVGTAIASRALAASREPPALPGVTARVVCCEKGGGE